MIGKRIELDGKNTESGGQQFVSGRGLFGDGYTRIHRIEPHGFASSPVAGAKALLIAPNADADQAYVLGGEHQGHRPSLPGGGTALYDASGNIIKLIGSEAIMDFQSNTVTFTAGDWTINCSTTFKGSMTIIGNLEVDGSIHATGTITSG